MFEDDPPNFDTFDTAPSEDYMTWILQRNVPVSGVYVNVSFESNAYTRKKYLREHGKKIRRLIVGYERDIVEFADLKGLATNLDSQFLFVQTELLGQG